MKTPHTNPKRSLLFELGPAIFAGLAAACGLLALAAGLHRDNDGWTLYSPLILFFCLSACGSGLIAGVWALIGLRAQWGRPRQYRLAIGVATVAVVAGGLMIRLMIAAISAV